MALSEAGNDPPKELENVSALIGFWLYVRAHGFEAWIQLVVEVTKPKINAVPESTMVDPL